MVFRFQQYPEIESQLQCSPTFFQYVEPFKSESTPCVCLFLKSLFYWEEEHVRSHWYKDFCVLIYVIRYFSRQNTIYFFPHQTKDKK